MGLVASTKAHAARRGALRVMVADGLAQYWMMNPPEGVASLAELRGAATARCHQLLGAAQPWHVTADWHARHAFLCAAMPAWVVEGVQAALGGTAQVDAALPTVLRHAAQAMRGDGWLCVTSLGCSSVLSTARGRLRSLRSMRTAAAAHLDTQLTEAARELRRERLRNGAATDDTAHWCHIGGGLVKQSAAKSVEFDGLRFEPLGGRLLSLAAGPAHGSDAEAAAALCALD